jgi:heat shock protein HslJ
VNHQHILAAALAASLVGVLPLAASGQDEPLVTPEGIDWTLTSYYDDESAEYLRLPFDNEASLRLQDGSATGSGGCNQFSGSYQIDGSALRFSEEMAVTLALCEEDIQTIEDAYLAALGQVEGWTIDAGVLELSDDFGEVILTFEVPDIMWTSSQLAGLLLALDGLQAEVERLSEELVTLRGEMEADNVDRLRERIRTLESESKQFSRRLDALEAQPRSDSGSGGTTAFSSAEQVLLEGIPSRIKSRCTPLRSALPKNTKAAVRCRPNTGVVTTVDYYLLEGEAAAAAYQTEMSAFNVPQATSATETCEQGVKSQRQWVGGGWQADGCYRTGGRAEVRFVDNATECRKLKVGNSTLQSPSLYIGVQGGGRDVEGVYGWATRNLDPGTGQLTSLSVPIERPNAAWSPACPR